MPDPTDDQLRDYAAQIPQIYKDLLAAIPAIDQNRRTGDPVPRLQLEDRLVDEGRDIRIADVQTAMDELMLQKFIRFVSGSNYVVPTPIGERLITILTNHQPRPETIPKLPQPSWAV